MSEEKMVELVVDGEVAYRGPAVAFTFSVDDGKDEQELQTLIHGSAPRALPLLGALLMSIDEEAQGATLQLILDALTLCRHRKV